MKRNAWQRLGSDRISLISIKTWLQHTSTRLARVSESPSLDAQVLLAHVMEKPRPWVLAHPEALLATGQVILLEEVLARLEAGEPLPYVLGHWEFYSLDFVVTPATLIPRPETELLVDQALAWLERSPGHGRALDVGTGTGCIAIALAAHVPGLRFLASDISISALKIAQLNVHNHALEGRIQLVQSDLAPAIHGAFDLICANLPYIPSETLKGLQVAQYEPILALDGGADGLDFISRILASSMDILAPGGLMLLEIESSQGPAVEALARQTFPAADVQIMVDLGRKDRLVKIQTI
jgi:release factor glutamine methyltransferase